MFTALTACGHDHPLCHHSPQDVDNQAPLYVIASCLQVCAHIFTIHRTTTADKPAEASLSFALSLSLFRALSLSLFHALSPSLSRALSLPLSEKNPETSPALNLDAYRLRMVAGGLLRTVGPSPRHVIFI